MYPTTCEHVVRVSQRPDTPPLMTPSLHFPRWLYTYMYRLWLCLLSSSNWQSYAESRSLSHLNPNHLKRSFIKVPPLVICTIATDVHVSRQIVVTHCFKSADNHSCYIFQFFFFSYLHYLYTTSITLHVLITDDKKLETSCNLILLLITFTYLCL